MNFLLQAWRMLRRIRNHWLRVQRNLLYPRVQWGKDVVIHGKIVIRGPGRVTIGERCLFDNASDKVNRILTFDEAACVTIGQDCYLNGVEIASRVGVSIGPSSMVGTCHFMDTDFHSTEILRHELGARVREAAIVIGRNAWIANHTIILKGVSVGENSVVGAGTVLRKSVPANVIVIGNPQQACRKIVENQVPS